MDASRQETSAPGVVAIMVAKAPGSVFDEAIDALANQDYANLQILVLVAPGGEDPTDRIAARAPGAFIRLLSVDRGFGAAVDDAAPLIKGATFLVLCHDDVVMERDAVSIMVETSFRLNAGIVTPKYVRYDDPRVLLHVGQSVDKTGAIVERVQATERDVGQHDAEREVFCAPGGATLVRADLFEALGGFDSSMVAMGEDLDLSWRARVAGARVVVAPDARVRHAELIASGQRGIPRRGHRSSPNLQELRRRHELRTVLTCLGPWHLVRVLPQILVLMAGEVLASLVVGDRDRAASVVGALRWNVSHLISLIERRRALRKVRATPDREIRRMQIRGSARLSTYIARLSHLGLEAAHGIEGSDSEALLTASFGTAFSEDDSFDLLDDTARRSGRDRFGRRVRRRVFASRRSRVVVWLVAIVVLLIGLRGVIFGTLPQFAQLVPFPSWTSSWHQLVSSWQSAGFGTTAPSSPGFGLLAAAGTFFFGHMGLLEKAILIGALPLGAYGVARVLRAFASPRASFAGALAYIGLPLYFDSLAQGRIDGIIVYALGPWLFAALARVAGIAPFDAPGPVRWSSTTNGKVLSLALLEAIGIAFAPSTLFVVMALVVGILGAGWIAGPKIDAKSLLARVGAASAIALVLLAPWLIGQIASGGAIVGVFGHPGTSTDALGWSHLARFVTGPVGQTPITWALPLAGALPMFVCRGERQAWVSRLWVGALVAWALSLASDKGWMAPFAPAVPVVLVAAALGVALSIGLGVAAYDYDLPEMRFGWRQLLAPLSVVALAVGIAPLLPAALNGRYDTPSVGYEAALSVLADPATHGSYRVLWLGDPNALPARGWSIGPGLSYALTQGNSLGGSQFMVPAGAGPAGALGKDIELALSGATENLGRLLSPGAIRYIAVVNAVAPVIPSNQSPPSYQGAPGLLRVLRQQNDLTSVTESDSGFSMFANSAVIPQWAERSITSGGKVGTDSFSASPNEVSGWRPVLGASTAPTRGAIRSGVVFSSYAPASAWKLSVGATTVRRVPAFGWASQFTVEQPGVAMLTQDAFPWGPLGGSLVIVAWVIVILALWPRRRLIDKYWAPLRAHLVRYATPVRVGATIVGRLIGRGLRLPLVYMRPVLRATLGRPLRRLVVLIAGGMKKSRASGPTAGNDLRRQISAGRPSTTRLSDDEEGPDR